VANPDQHAIVAHYFDYDVSQGGATFSDPDGDALTYEIRGAWAGLQEVGTRIVGTPREAVGVSFWIIARDGRGGEATDFFIVTVAPNAIPTVVQSNQHQIIAVGARVDYDTRRATFVDADGDPLTYTATFETEPHGLRLIGQQVAGVFADVGLVRVKIAVDDGYGGTASDTFVIAAPGPEPGRPTLPARSYAYNDDELAKPLPLWFQMSRGNDPPLWDKSPRSDASTNALATLGRVLFYDKRLSITNTHSCASCHVQSLGFATSTRFGTGVQGLPTARNPMGLANVRYTQNDRFFMDERAQTLAATVLMPIEDPIELGQPLSLLEPKLADTDFYPPLFAAAFGSPEVTRARVGAALAQFLFSMVSYQSRFDLAFQPMTFDDIDKLDPPSVLTAEELRGFDLFSDKRCGNCHHNDVHIIGTALNNGLDVDSADRGNGTQEFRTAALRNVAFTAPYMHDGRFSTLREVIDHYDHGVQPNANLSSSLRESSSDPTPFKLNLSEEERAALEAYLHTLTDDYLLTDPKFSDPFP